MDDEDKEELILDEDLPVESEHPEEPEETDTITVEGDEPEPEEEEEHAEAPKWVKEVRTHNRELKKKVRELESQLTRPAPVAEVIKKPKLEEFDYDADKYDAAMLDYAAKKLKAEEAENAKKREQEQAEAEWKSKLETYEKSKKTLRVKDFDEAEDTVKELFNPTQQGIIVNGAELPAELVYVIGRNPKRAKELADIKDPVKFAFAVAKLETKLKVERKEVPAPERKIVSGGGSAVASTSNLERLKEEARKTGNWDKYFAAKRK